MNTTLTTTLIALATKELFVGLHSAYLRTVQAQLDRKRTILCAHIARGSLAKKPHSSCYHSSQPQPAQHCVCKQPPQLASAADTTPQRHSNRQNVPNHWSVSALRKVTPPLPPPTPPPLPQPHSLPPPSPTPPTSLSMPFSHLTTGLAYSTNLIASSRRCVDRLNCGRGRI